MPDEPPAGHHPNLTPYQGRAVVGASIVIRKTGDGLSRALAIDPAEFEVGSRVTVVLDCIVDKHRHEPEEKGVYDRLIVVNDLKADRATFIDRELVEAALDEQQRLIEEAEGVHQLDLDGDEEGEFPLDPPPPEGEWDDEGDTASEA